MILALLFRSLPVVTWTAMMLKIAASSYMRGSWVVCVWIVDGRYFCTKNIPSHMYAIDIDRPVPSPPDRTDRGAYSERSFHVLPSVCRSYEYAVALL